MSTSDLTNLVNQLAHTLDELPRGKIAKIFDVQLQQMKAPKQNRKSNFCCYFKEPGHWEKTVTNVSTSVALSPLANLSNVILANDRCRE